MIDPIESFDPKAVLARLYPAADLSFLDDLTEEERWLVAGEFLLEANAPIAEFFGLTDSDDTEDGAPFTGVSG